MPIKIRESHIRATIADVQRQCSTEVDQPNEATTHVSEATVNQIVEKVMARLERKLKKMQER